MSGVLNPATLFVGGEAAGGGGVVYRMGSGTDDDGQPVAARAETQVYAPAGVGGEAVFTALMPVLSYTGGCAVRFTPIVDGVVYDGTDAEDARITVSFTPPSSRHRVRWVGNLGLSRPHARNGVERLRAALRGTWFQLRVEPVTATGVDADGNPGELVLEGHDAEWEEVENTVVRVATGVYAAPLDGSWLLDGSIGLGG